MRGFVCVHCGKPFMANGTRNKFCSEACKVVAQRDQKRAYENKKKALKLERQQKSKNIGEVSAAAKKAGMTYGQYVSKFGV